MPTMTPVSLRATAATKTTLAVVWGAPESGPAPTSYEIRLDGGAALDVGPVTSHIFAALTPDTPYEVAVRAVSGEGPSAWVSRTLSTVAFLREHFYRPIRNGKGELVLGATVAIYKTGTTVPLDVPIYVDPSGDAQRGPAWVAEDGIVDFYLPVPQIVDIAVIVPGRPDPVTFRHQWVGDILDVDLTNDTVMTTIDFDPNTDFRKQQDARHAGLYAAKTIQTEVETGRLSTTSLDAAYKTPLTTHVAAASNAHAASAISFTPTGQISSNTVQAALAELDTEKATTGSVTTVQTNLTNHISNAAGAHAASAISFAPTGNIAATTVQAALAELDTEKETPAGATTKANTAVETHRTDTTDVHGIADTSALETQTGAQNKANAAAAAVETVAATAAQFGDDAHAVNTTGKKAGRPGFDTTGGRPVWATGSTPTSTWVYADGTVAFTPA